MHTKELKSTLHKLENCAHDLRSCFCSSGLSPPECRLFANRLTNIVNELQRNSNELEIDYRISLSMFYEALRQDEIERQSQEAQVLELQTLLWQKSESNQQHQKILAKSATAKLVESIQELDPCSCLVSSDLEKMKLHIENEK